MAASGSTERTAAGKSIYRMTRDAADAMHDQFYALQHNRGWVRSHPVGIYLATCAETGMGYVGQSCGVWARVMGHFSAAFRSGSQSLFHCALREYGADAFKWRLLAVVDGNAADETETLAIQAFKTLSPRGYNQKFAVCASGHYGVDLRQLPLIAR